MGISFLSQGRKDDSNSSVLVHRGLETYGPGSYVDVVAEADLSHKHKDVAF